ncbi:MAG: phosphatidylserine/phosphatidylglycerophosphate/cardiolipin synthase family protein [Thermodesulfobacteriota bacterium]|nr:phosphatidylserine/phosphatidylglycerophosphate/cardiolipin synthase family protein [Thermodesulfobacteriota bacterium]
MKHRPYLFLSLLTCILIAACISPVNAVRDNIQDKGGSSPDICIYPQPLYEGQKIFVDLATGGTGNRVATIRIGDVPCSIQKTVDYNGAQGEPRCCIMIEPKKELNPEDHRLTLGLVDKKGTTDNKETQLRVRRRQDKAPCILKQQTLSRMDAITHTTTIPCNHVDCMDNGPHAFLRYLEVLRGAKQQINIQTYYLDNAGRCKEITAILMDKADQGLEINIIITRYSQLAKSPLLAMILRSHGIHVILAGDIGFPRQRPDRSIPWIDRMHKDYRIFESLPEAKAFQPWIKKDSRDMLVDFALHEKMLIVDNRIAIMGGRNISDSYFFWWRDLDVCISGKAVHALNKGFMVNWQEFGGARPMNLPETRGKNSPGKGHTTLRIVESRPWHGDYDNLEMIVEACSLAQKSIYITSQYLALPDRISRALSGAASRGVDVRILTNSYDTGKAVAFSMCHFISLNYYRELLEDGVKIYEYHPEILSVDHPPYYHAKQIIIDRQWLSIGSFNLSIRSAYLESELMLNIHDPKLAKKRSDQFLYDLKANCRQVDPCVLASQEQRFRDLMEISRKVEILY